MRRRGSLPVLALALALAAQSGGAQGASSGPPGPAPAPGALAGTPWPSKPRPGWPRVQGVVERVDAGAGEVELRHGAIPNLGMDAMTMAFQLRNPVLLGRLRPGDRVEFQADLQGAEPAIVWLKKRR